MVLLLYLCKIIKLLATLFMKKTYQPINCGFHDVLLAVATRRIYSRIHYITEIGEWLYTDALIKDVFTRNKEEFLKLSSGEEIRLDRVLQVNEQVSPHYAEFTELSCDC